MWHPLAPRPETGTGPVPAPTFSVVIAAYQAAGYIPDAIESVLAQTHPALEILVCDDGSTDGLEQALEPFGDKVHLLRRAHGGQSAARNVCIRAATGEFVSILDADDVFLPQYLEAVAHAASVRPDLDIITTNAYLELDGRLIGRYYPDRARFVVGDQRLGAIHNHFIFGLASLRRSRLLRVGGFDESLHQGEDTDCFLRLILDGARAGLVDEPLASYRLRHGSVSANRATGLQQAVRILERAASHGSLTQDERVFLAAQLSTKRAEARLAEAEAAAIGREQAARSRALAVAFNQLPPGYGYRTRVKAVAAAIAPRLAGRVLSRRAGSGRGSLLRTDTRGR